MITIQELIDYLEYVKREYGNDSKIAIQAHTDTGNIIGGYVSGIVMTNDGTTILVSKHTTHKEV